MLYNAESEGRSRRIRMLLKLYRTVINNICSLFDKKLLKTQTSNWPCGVKVKEVVQLKYVN